MKTSKIYNVAVILSVMVVVTLSKGNECPYGRPTVKYDNEVVGFLVDSTSSTWNKLHWQKLTTLALFMDPDPELICLAHKHRVRVVAARNFPVASLTNGTARQEWVKDKVAFVKRHKLDGINIDFESAIPKTHLAQKIGLNDLVNETSESFRSAIKGSQVSFDVAWSPDGIDGRYYDYKTIADLVDFVFVMAYDERSQIYGECKAGANSDYQRSLQGMSRYLDIGIPTNKIVLGVPWYGYKYICLNLTHQNKCVIKKIPFHGAPCSDAAGTEVPYTDVLDIFKKHNISDRLWDDNAKSPYFNFKIDGSLGQIWYDDPVSLNYKYEMALKYNFLGVGMWTANFLDYSNTTEGWKQRNQMWGAIPYTHDSFF
ncbi:CTBS (predicted) [Pycnogonum litorale]